jgi:hypothetical protein
VEQLWNRENEAERIPAKDQLLANRQDKRYSASIGFAGSPPKIHGKEGIDGSSPSEALQKARSLGFAAFATQSDLQSVLFEEGTEPLWSLQLKTPQECCHC